MLKEVSVRAYLINTIKKYLDEMKCGKLWLDACFKFLLPDMIMFLEHVGGLEPVGCLGPDEFYSNNADGAYIGEYLIERNPHICRSEHVVLNGVENNQIHEYCTHFENLCMVNCKSLVAQRMNGADFDGDLCFLVNNHTILSGGR